VEQKKKSKWIHVSWISHGVATKEYSFLWVRSAKAMVWNIFAAFSMFSPLVHVLISHDRNPGKL
jgi:hypothetical protein